MNTLPLYYLQCFKELIQFLRNNNIFYHNVFIAIHDAHKNQT